MANLAPYSFFNLINDRPPLVMFSSSGHKDSVSNLTATGEFVVNLATRALADQMNATSRALPSGVDEFEAAGLEKATCRLVAVPRVAQSPAALECRVVSIQRLAGLDGAEVDSWLTIGQIVAVQIDDAMLIDGRYCTELARPILRAGYAADYWEIGAEGKFAMRRPD